MPKYGVDLRFYLRQRVDCAAMHSLQATSEQPQSLAQAANSIRLSTVTSAGRRLVPS